MFSPLRLSFGFMTAVVSGMTSQAQTADVLLKANDRIVFLGDSITQAGAGPNGYVTLVRDELQKNDKGLKFEVIGAGISGNKVPDLEKRLDRDVLSKKPTVVVIYIGINDVWHGESDPAKGTLPERFNSGLGGIVDKIQASGARVILATPSLIGEKKNGANKMDAKLDQYAAITRKLAKEKKTGLCDLRQAFLDHEAKNNPENKDEGILTSDRVHLNDAGNKFVAEQMLKAFGR